MDNKLIIARLNRSIRGFKYLVQDIIEFYETLISLWKDGVNIEKLKITTNNYIVEIQSQKNIFIEFESVPTSNEVRQNILNIESLLNKIINATMNEIKECIINILEYSKTICD